MHIHAVLNRDGGALAGTDIDAFSRELEQTFRRAGHEIELQTVSGSEIVEAIRAATDRAGVDTILVAGGDGTASLAAGLLADSDKVLALLPAGTMNLFARSLGIPLDLEVAIEALAGGRIRRVDVARANGRPFVHQFSIGMHPQLIHLRSRIPFKGRFGKRLASARAALTTFMRPHNLTIALSMGETELITKTSGLSITNNLYGEGHLPFADRPDGGVLGIYVTRARRRLDLIAFFFNMALGRWRENEQVEIHEAGDVQLRILSPERRFRCAIDGELCALEEQVRIKSYPRCLAVLVPAEE